VYLLDTSVISELRKKKPHGAVLAWLNTVAEADMHISAVTLAEIQAGIELTRAQDKFKASEIEAWLEQVIATINVLPMDGKEFRLWAQLMHGRSNTISEDIMIAATARLNQLTVVTRNVSDFKGLGVAVLNPFKAIAGLK
jgi:toxin FitB